ncbi:MAG: methyltransferase, partial [Nanoarchaeota archaeon]|nr:methyltransferase [Nanoarchaeota archaeon]
KIGSKKALEMVLSRLKGFKEAKVRDEQYITPADIASEVLWKAYFNSDIEDKVIADLGSGTGILGIGCLVLGARKVIFVEKDSAAMEICRQNLEILKSEGYDAGRSMFIEGDVKDFCERADCVFTNPPFGTKKKHADKEFLLKAFEISNMTYSFHKSSTNEYIIDISRKNGFEIRERFCFKFLLKNTMKHHTKGKKYIDVSCFVFEKNN